MAATEADQGPTRLLKLRPRTCTRYSVLASSPVIVAEVVELASRLSGRPGAFSTQSASRPAGGSEVPR